MIMELTQEKIQELIDKAVADKIAKYVEEQANLKMAKIINPVVEEVKTPKIVESPKILLTKAKTLAEVKSIKALIKEEEYNRRMAQLSSGLSLNDIAIKEGVTPASLSTWYKAHGKPYNNSRVDKRLELYNEGKSFADIAKILNIKPDTIRAWGFSRGLKSHRKVKPLSTTTVSEVSLFNNIHSLDLSKKVEPIRDTKPFTYLIDKNKDNVFKSDKYAAEQAKHKAELDKMSIRDIAIIESPCEVKKIESKDSYGKKN